MPVMQPSAWQQEYSRFNRVQHELLNAGSAAAAVTAK
jgi:formate dehydrogenase major subunit